MTYFAHIIEETQRNAHFRKVLFTGAQSQLVVMTIPPATEVGEETHDHVEQTLFFESGSGEAHLDGSIQPVTAGDVVVVTPGVRHNFLNTGSTPLRIFTVYAPANHIDGRVHETKVDADHDEEDEAFGHRA